MPRLQVESLGKKGFFLLELMLKFNDTNLRVSDGREQLCDPPVLQLVLGVRDAVRLLVRGHLALRGARAGLGRRGLAQGESSDGIDAKPVSLNQ